jgi:hypothetical protein
MQKQMYLAKDGEKYLFDEDTKTIQKLQEKKKTKTDVRPYIWLTGVLFVSAGVGFVDYRAGLIVFGMLLLLTALVSS